MRIEKINSQIQKALMEVIQSQVDDPAATLLSITRVETTGDLQESKVFFSLLNDNNYKKVSEILRKMNGFLRASMAKKISLRIVPQLKFIPDDSIKYNVDICKKIDEVRSEDARRAEERKQEDDNKEDNK